MRVQLASVTLDMCENEISTLGQSGRPHTVDPHYLLHRPLWLYYSSLPSSYTGSCCSVSLNL